MKKKGGGVERGEVSEMFPWGKKRQKTLQMMQGFLELKCLIMKPEAIYWIVRETPFASCSPKVTEVCEWVYLWTK